MKAPLISRVVRDSAGQPFLEVNGSRVYLTAEEVRTVTEKIAVAGKTLLWFHGAGSLIEQESDRQAFFAALGFEPERHDHTNYLKVESFLNGQRWLSETDGPIGPVFCGRSGETPEVLGWQAHHPYGPGLVRTRFANGHTALWSAAPKLPAGLLSLLAADAGVHIYHSGGSQIFASREILGIHVFDTGPQTIELPGDWELEPLFGNPTESRREVNRLSFQAVRGETLAWRHHAPPHSLFTPAQNLP